MDIISLTFYLFAGITVASGLMVISSRNPVHSVLWLILAFFSAAGLFVLMGAEYLAMLLVIVYVGAVAVLFLFVVMMLDINFVELRQGVMTYLPIGVIVGLILALELITLGSAWYFADDVTLAIGGPASSPTGQENIRVLGNLIYTDYLFIFQAAGLVLLVAMIGAIVLTLRSRPGVRRQDVAAQVARRPEDSYRTVTVATGEGVDPTAAKPNRKRGPETEGRAA